MVGSQSCRLKLCLSLKLFSKLNNWPFYLINKLRRTYVSKIVITYQQSMRQTHISFMLVLLLIAIIPASICSRGDSTGSSSYSGQSNYYNHRYYDGPVYHAGYTGSYNGQSSLVGVIVGTVLGGLCLCGVLILACVRCKFCNCRWLPCSKFQ